MLTTMMDRPLLISSLLWRAENVFADRVGVSCDATRGDREFTYRDLGATARRFAGSFENLGIGFGTRVATLAWNTFEHLVAYYAVPACGAVLHTVNHRMSPEHIAYTMDKAEDEVVLIDADLLPVLLEILPRLARIRHVVVIGDLEQAEYSISAEVTWWSFDGLLLDAVPIEEFPEFDERTASSICFTSGTTGLPKGVVYSHRSTVLHAMAISASGGVAIDGRHSYLLATQMSHVHSWGVPYAGVLQGARLVLPGPHPSPAELLRIITDQTPDVFVGAPAVAALMRAQFDADPEGYDLGSLQTMWLGGQVLPAVLVRWWAERGVATVNGWGMTETSPMGTFSNSADCQGRPLPLFQVRVVDEEGRKLPWNGFTTGELEVRSPWVTGTYLDDDRAAEAFDAGWLRSGDVAVIHPDGRLEIRDRVKDLIKSGGEWISSVEVENQLLLHPAVVEAAVIAVPHETWQERPVAWVRTTQEVSDDQLRAHLAVTLPKFWLPDTFVRVEEVPKTSVGKLDKVRMRRMWAQKSAV
ncbi:MULTISPECIES: long-chain-fatty-acid--CoA ligase [Rhodococcus]|uniref:long-chain-fatty-acid--CoA ligase n=1 Tax=Rhodococcus TaxID=1827 RepID=UPI00132EE97B|nr:MULTISPECIES: long-chain-fatty-acid--CoA ligase [Rhodococcus]MCZ1075692.1 long-chain-fatty-acid--CoA ligase [Rhodococcus sp. A5(2022)]QHG85426.1 fatty-acid--CoA ligase [Rhodococcus rhodochrous]